MLDLQQILKQATDEIASATDIPKLEQVRVAYLGKKGSLTDVLRSVSSLSPAERPKVGQEVNQIKVNITEQIKQQREFLLDQELAKKLEKEHIDVTLPGRRVSDGSYHPVSKVLERINSFFLKLGFEIVLGPEIETEHYNFEALNIPASHPARAMHDTFYFSDGTLLRTHTSPVQIRAMESRKPPVRLIAPGRVYRRDSDITHTPMFHQLEGLVIDETANFANLKGVLQDFFNFFFERELKLRFRPSYFPFTEPSAEADLECTHCSGKGCRTCKYTGWLEVIGCGMVHPSVIESMNLDSDKYQGWAFGLGIDRLAMLYYGIDDLRVFFESDLKFLEQF